MNFLFSFFIYTVMRQSNNYSYAGLVNEKKHRSSCSQMFYKTGVNNLA